MGSVTGNNVKLTIFGESHGSAIGGVLDNLPSGAPFNEELLRSFMQRRKSAGKVGATPRTEADEVRILSGVFRGRITGTPLGYITENTNTKSADYDFGVARPSHADYTGYLRYKGFNDYRGGGHFSGRLTAPIVAAGAIAQMCLEGMNIYACTHIKSIADIEDAPLCDTSLAAATALCEKNTAFISDAAAENTQKLLETLRAKGDSAGGIIECVLMNIPAGIGNPVFEGFESALAKLLFSIPAVMGVEFGRGFEISKLRGSEANDALRVEKGKIISESNNCGGINGGITNGMPIVMRVAFKPTPSIAKEQRSVDFVNMRNSDLALRGRHDACIALRAPVVVESCALLCALDFLRGGML